MNGKALVLYFSGTGHTKAMLEVLKKRMEKEGDFSVLLHSIEDNGPAPDIGEFDLVVFSYPIHAFNMPLDYERHIRKLDFSRGRAYAILKQSGEPHFLNDASSRTLLRRIRRSGKPFYGEWHLLMPYNIHFRYPDFLVKRILEGDRLLLDAFLRKLGKDETSSPKERILLSAVGWFFRIERFAGPLAAHGYAVDPTRCVSCLQCVRSCPRKNIRLEEGKILFGRNCLLCMRCAFHCPKDAIHMGLFEKWKVNGAYPLRAIESSSPKEDEEFKKKHRWFLSLFPKWERNAQIAREKAFSESVSEE